MTANLHESIWNGHVSKSNYPQLQGDYRADVVVIGAGITGLTTAWNLKKDGKSVIVLEAGTVGSGTTGYSTAHITTSYDYDYHQLRLEYGEEEAKLLAQALIQSINHIEQTINEIGINCAFRRLPGYYYAETSEGLNTIEAEWEAIKSFGTLKATRINEVALPFATAGGIQFDDQAQFDPLAYVTQLAATQGPAVIFEHSQVVSIGDHEVATEKGKVSADYIIHATHTPLGRSPLHMVVAPYRSYVMAFKLKESETLNGLFWDTKDPYTYIRASEINGEPVIIVGGKDLKTGHEDETNAFETLESFVHQHFDVDSIVGKWSAQLYEPSDHLPKIGALPMREHHFVATGFSGDGITLGTLSGIMLAEQVAGRKTPFDELFRPGRVNLQGASDFLKENADAAKCFIKGHWPFKGHHTDPADLSPGDGTVVTRLGREIAAFRTESGELRQFSAICPHMGCTVQWNAAEKTFDCPCHGSRFDTRGAVIEGPAMSGLTPHGRERASKAPRKAPHPTQPRM